MPRFAGALSCEADESARNACSTADPLVEWNRKPPQCGEVSTLTGGQRPHPEFSLSGGPTGIDGDIGAQHSNSETLGKDAV